jgi:uncharacterized caspase-like protein
MRALVIVLSMVAILVTANSANADQRIAFVVGNGTYKYTDRLPNAPISAKAMTRLLQSVGFEVVEGIDLTRDKMTERLLDFGMKAEGADVALFFYTGHAIAINGTNYLLPIDADIKSEMDVKLGAAINIDLAVDQAMSDAKVKLVFLDTSRENPFVGNGQGERRVSVQSGLAEMKSGEGTLIAFATGPGQTAPDGPVGSIRPFTRALIANIAAPGLEIQLAMIKVRAQVNDETNAKQSSRGFTNLLADFYLNPVAAAPIAPTTAK